MRELTIEEIQDVSGCFKFHFNVILTVFTAIGAGIIGGPVAAGIVVSAAVATQGTKNLVDMYIDEFGQVQVR